MFASFLNSLGDRNPQLLREFKSRLRGRGLGAAIGLSGLAQLLLLAFYRVSLTASPRRYCTVQAEPIWQSCLDNGEVQWELINWSIWWRDIFVAINWALPIILTGLGMYLLIGDIQQEEQRGTLNFIRLSPRRGSTVFLGKLLGVPVLVYLAIALTVPLHLLAALGAQAAPGFVVSYYLLLLLDGLLFLSIATVVGLLAPRAVKERALLSGGATLAVPLLSAAFLVPYQLLSRVVTVWHPYTEYLFGEESQEQAWQWYGLDFSNFFVAHSVQILFLGTITFWLWRILRRVYQQPNATPLSKRQSYGMTVSGLVLFLGLVSPMSAVGDLATTLGVVLLIILIWIGCAVVFSAILPSRQTLLDWVQTRRMQRPETRSPLLLELLAGNRSPGTGAVLVNLLLISGISLAWLSQLPESFAGDEFGNDLIRLGLLLTLLMIAIYAALAQNILFLKTPKRTNWAVASVGFAALLPMVCAAIAAVGQLELVARLLMLFSPLPWFALFEEAVPPLMIGSVILIQMLMLSLLLWKLAIDLNRSRLVEPQRS